MDNDQERLLPIANVGRIMKQVLPPNAKISKEAKQRMQDCATEFISFVTAEASDKCQKENRKTMNGDDICWALTALGLDHYSDSIFRYLQRFREHERRNYRTPSKSTGDPNKGMILLATNNTIITSSQQDQDQEERGRTENRVVSSDVPTFQFMIIEKGMSSSSSPKTT